jgi:2-polyprenyl-6-methoxyphenol hydroxylase-like FAD-dependent oxidoreductase
MRHSIKVAIVGGGTGGLCLAHGLKRADIAVAVYERDCTRRDGLQGYRVGISPQGSRALHACLPPDLFEIFVATCARPPSCFNIMTEQFSELLSLHRADDGDPLNSEKAVSRMTLRQVLLTGLEDVVHFDKNFTHYEQLSDGKVNIFFEDGTCASADILVGADGASSRVRKQFLPHAKLQETGILSIGAKVSLTAETKALLPAKVFNGVTLIAAPKGYGAILHVMEFKWDRNGIKNGIGSTDGELIRQWPGMLFDNTNDYIMWGFWAARQRYRVDPKSLSGAELLRLAMEMTKNWHPNFRRLLERSDVSTALSINIRTSVPVAPWETTNITLLGDAIHTMTPGRGVGANTALRDAALLSLQLEAVRDGNKTVIQAIREYEAEIIRYGFEAVRESRKQMDSRALIHKPIVGRAVLALNRLGMRMANSVAPIKRRMAEAQARFRGANRKELRASACGK